MNGFDFFKQFIGPEDLVFDIGANIGQSAILFATLCKQVIAVEPSDGSFDYLRKIGEHKKIRSIHKAIGAQPGRATIATCSKSPIVGTGSMSPAWIDAVIKSNRFKSSEYWDRIQVIEVITLDQLIEECGEPAFIKIDVEGNEVEVLKGLSRPVKALSFEFVRECPEPFCNCVARCLSLGMWKFNLSFKEELELGEWTDGPGIIARMMKMRDDGISYGDVYAIFQ